ncbi:MAG TPA: PHB depolymerase family esterase [Gemmatimonadales bacterium]|nr:PHB depolymerase family esterase [Gemmatimonadales bacterium]
MVQRQAQGAWETGAGVGRLRARPGAGQPPPLESPPTGSRPLGLERVRDGLLHVPPGYDAALPAPLVVMLHGAGGDAPNVLGALAGLADRHGLLLLLPDSRGPTWDVIAGGWGPDVAFLDRALSAVFEEYAVDPARLAVAGFSDGASYALSLGLANGDLFTHVVAFSPGFAAPPSRHGAPRVFVSHGTADRVLPIDRCSRRLVPRLEADGYDVTYREFPGGHAIPPAVAAAAVGWLGGRAVEGDA